MNVFPIQSTVEFLCFAPYLQPKCPEVEVFLNSMFCSPALLLFAQDCSAQYLVVLITHASIQKLEFLLIIRRRFEGRHILSSKAIMPRSGVIQPKIKSNDIN